MERGLAVQQRNRITSIRCTKYQQFLLKINPLHKIPAVLAEKEEAPIKFSRKVENSFRSRKRLFEVFEANDALQEKEVKHRAWVMEYENRKAEPNSLENLPLNSPPYK